MIGILAIAISLSGAFPSIYLSIHGAEHIQSGNFGCGYDRLVGKSELWNAAALLLCGPTVGWILSNWAKTGLLICRASFWGTLAALMTAVMCAGR